MYKDMTQEEVKQKFFECSSYRDACDDDSIMKRVAPTYHGSNPEEGMLILKCNTGQWAANPMGILHGGITATMFDTGCGLMVRVISGVTMITTVSLNVNYLKPVQIGPDIYLKMKLVSEGRTICTVTGEMYSGDGKLLVATATITYMILKKGLKK